MHGVTRGPGWSRFVACYETRLSSRCVLDVKHDTGTAPWSTRVARRHDNAGCCLPGEQTRRYAPTINFSGVNTRKVGSHPFPLHLAFFRSYASMRPLPAAPQGSILGSRHTGVGSQVLTCASGTSQDPMPVLCPRPFAPLNHRTICVNSRDLRPNSVSGLNVPSDKCNAELNEPLGPVAPCDPALARAITHNRFVYMPLLFATSKLARQVLNPG